MKKRIWDRTKIIAVAVWHAPGVENLALQLLIRVLARFGIGAAIGAVVMEVLKAIGATF